MRTSKSALTRTVAIGVLALTASSLSSAAPYSFRVAARGIKPVAAPAAPATLVPFKFTTCGMTGPTGPSSSQCDAAYAGTSLAGLVSVAGGKQSWTVPSTGNYSVLMAGAVGGSASYQAGYPGGRGAFLALQLSLTQGDVLQILVGQPGTDVEIVAGGGGGTYIVKNGAPLAVAGGGGGANAYAYIQAQSASTTTALTTNSSYSNNAYGYSCGAGFAASGPSATGQFGGFGTAFSFLSGGAGASVFSSGTGELESGGFGGGGGGGFLSAGGGGGYSPTNIGSGNGGNSYSSVVGYAASASNGGPGYVTITKN